MIQVLRIIVFRYTKLFIFGLIIFLVTSCTKVDFGYTLATKMIKGRIYDTFEFKPKSKKTEIDIYLNSELKKNKRKTLDELSLFIQDVQKNLPKDEMTIDTVHKLFDRAKALRQNVILVYKDVFTTVIKKIEQSEIEHFQKFTNRQISNLIQDAQDETEFLEKKETSFKRTISFFMGEINEKQFKSIQFFLKKHKQFFINQINFRSKYFKKFYELYPHYDKMQDLTFKFYSGHENIYSSNEVVERQVFEGDLKILLLDLWNSADLEQKKQFRDTLSSVFINLQDKDNSF